MSRKPIPLSHSKLEEFLADQEMRAFNVNDDDIDRLLDTAKGFRDAIRAYKSEMENPVKDLAMIELRRQELFALVP